MAQRQDLDILVAVTTRQPSQQRERVRDAQVRQSQQHGCGTIAWSTATADITRKTVDEWVELIARLHDAVATDAGDEREAGQAAANLWSGFGYLDAPTDVLRMFL